MTMNNRRAMKKPDVDWILLAMTLFEATAFLMLAFYLGQSIGPAMTGRLESMFNLQVGIGVCATFIILSSICCITARNWRKK